jgi:hypothetical protein
MRALIALTCVLCASGCGQVVLEPFSVQVPEPPAGPIDLILFGEGFGDPAAPEMNIWVRHVESSQEHIVPIDPGGTFTVVFDAAYTDEAPPAASFELFVDHDLDGLCIDGVDDAFVFDTLLLTGDDAVFVELDASAAELVFTSCATLSVPMEPGL